MSKYFAGVEGGATHSSAILINENGEQIAELENEPATNHWQLGQEGCAEILANIVRKLLVKANIGQDSNLSTLGLCLSGCEDKKSNDHLKSLLKLKFPDVENIEVESDTMGPIYVASDKGGIVLIAGTGSNLLLVNPDKKLGRCGGWGHMLGDQGSAWWIANLAIRECIMDIDKYKAAPFSIDFAWESIKEHFEIEEISGLLKHCYQSFDKSFFAKLTLKLAEGAQKGDKFCLWMFECAGEALARHLIAISSEVAEELFELPQGLPVVCVGSVWKSWEFLKDGFTRTLKMGNEKGDGSQILKKFSLIRLCVSPALGPALLAAPSINISYEKNFNTIYSFGL